MYSSDHNVAGRNNTHNNNNLSVSNSVSVSHNSVSNSVSANNQTHCEQPSKIVVFDLDETLGYFVELSLFWDVLQSYFEDSPHHFNQALFNSLLDLFPEFIRPNMFQILQYVQYKRKIQSCDKIMIYTNNRHSPEWPQYIKGYFEQKSGTSSGTPVFDQIIHAFKIKGQLVETLRTTNKKTHGDLLKCTRLPKQTQVCFVDNSLHFGMCNETIYYINVKSYIYKLPFRIMVDRFITSTAPRIQALRKCIINEKDFYTNMVSLLNEYDYKYVKKPTIEYDMDKVISKKLLHYLSRFFSPDMQFDTEQVVILNDVPTKKSNTRRKKHYKDK